MKTTLEIPDPVFRRAKSAAAERGIPLREFVTEAVEDKLASKASSSEKPWMAAFGKLRHLRKETARINRIIAKEFEQIETEDHL
jgi:hypothetical protein